MSNLDDDLLAEVFEDILGFRRSELTDDTRLFHDLKIAGIDGFDLLEEISERFGIAKDFHGNLESFFGPEAAYNPILHFLLWLRGRRLDEGVKPLTVSDLRRVIETRSWQTLNTIEHTTPRPGSEPSRK